MTGRWFVERRGLVSGVLTAGGASGQLVFLPLLAWTAEGGTPADDVEPQRAGAAAGALRGLGLPVRSRPFWLLAGGFFICGLSTNGLVQPHFVPAAHDHGTPVTTAAGLLAVVGVFDIVGAVLSGWLTDRVDPRLLLLGYYSLRGMSLFLLPPLFGPNVRASMVVFIVFYGLDWVATVPPTLALVRQHVAASTPVVFGWVFASHQLGSAVAASGGGVVRDVTGSYDLAFFVAGGLCVLAAGMSVAVRPPRREDPAGLSPPPPPAPATTPSGAGT